MASVTRRSSTRANRRATADAKILQATEQLLAGGASFTELGVQRITTEAGVVRSTFYLHFRDKNELLLRLIEPLADGAYDLISSTTVEQGLEGVEAIMIQDMRYYRERRHLLAAVLEVAGYDAVVREFWNSQIQRFTDLAEVWLRAEQEAGRTARDLEPATAARVLTWGGFQVLANHVLSGPESQDETVAREIAQLEWYGAFRRPAQA
ncbi:TetR/AcrR family transcriptional regulator [Micromonospora sp. WP24]|uniref:TetR/AcrR family transcriptional regulator n=1 Tax=Micromonospora TaxID=1873 RepID=UPI0011D455A0|nr:TetR/AcrR family transcriptional regulator [Micromonospora sp. WP24]TYC01617.1 TetR/AcrR family transcriptional regulator [Micromonospora sp. WP24]